MDTCWIEFRFCSMHSRFRTVTPFQHTDFENQTADMRHVPKASDDASVGVDGSGPGGCNASICDGCRSIIACAACADVPTPAPDTCQTQRWSTSCADRRRHYCAREKARRPNRYAAQTRDLGYVLGGTCSHRCACFLELLNRGLDLGIVREGGVHRRVVVQ